MKDLTQNQILLKWFNAGKSLTAIEASSRFGITQLSARLCEIDPSKTLIEHIPTHKNNKHFMTYRRA